MKRIILSFIILCIALTFAGCVETADRIYTVCKVEGDTLYVYNDSGEFFSYKEGKYLKHSGVGLVNRPALKLVTPSLGTYEFDAELPGLYHGTLESVSAYVQCLENSGYDSGVKAADYQNIELFCVSEDYSVRILFNIRGTVRIYAIDADKTSIEPPYI